MHLVVKNGDITFLQLELILADELADIYITICTVRGHIGRSTGRSNPPVQASSGQEWQFHISTVSPYWQINWQSDIRSA